MGATLKRYTADSDPGEIHGAIERDGAVIVEGLLSSDVVDAVNREVEEAVMRADPEEELFNPVMQAFHGPFTKQFSGMAGVSRTFATEVMCHPVLLGA
jgi:hypothetical protein